MLLMELGSESAVGGERIKETKRVVKIRFNRRRKAITNGPRLREEGTSEGNKERAREGQGESWALNAKQELIFLKIQSP